MSPTSSFEKAKQHIPGGVNSPVRAFKAVGGEPVFIEKAKGPYLYDVDGKQYIDYVLSWGPMILGHADEDVLNAVKEKINNGLSFGAPTEIETELANTVCEIMPGMDKVRFVSSGTEATMSAIRLARGFTGRDKIVKFEGCYHGHSDSLLIKAGSGALTFGVPSSPGVPDCLAEHTITLEYNNPEQVKAAFKELGDQIACVIVEPVAGNMNCIPPVPGFLESLRDNCTEYGAQLIFDEVMTGFRLGITGAQGYYGVQPDLTTLGKVIGGGMPVGAFGGREEVMNHIAPVGPVYQAGALFEKTAYLVKEIEAIAKELEVPLTTNHVGSMWGVFFSEEEKITNYQQVMNCNIPRFNQFFHGMLKRGVYLAPASYEAAFMSISHSEEDLNNTLKAVRETLEDIVKSAK